MVAYVVDHLVQRRGRAALALTEKIVAGVAGDGAQPGAKLACLVVGVQRAPGLDERVLRDVVALRHADPVVADAADVPLMSLDQHVECVQPSVESKHDELVVLEVL